MATTRIALANIRFPATPDESVTLAERAIRDAAAAGAAVVCFPECYVPGYRASGKPVPPIDPAFLEHAWSAIARTASDAAIAVVLIGVLKRRDRIVTPPYRDNPLPERSTIIHSLTA